MTDFLDIPILPTPPDASASRDIWRRYWNDIGYPWRTEPLISPERQQQLADCRHIEPNIEDSIFPFKNVALTRADVEWLLATHDNKLGPVDWSDLAQRSRRGIDVRGASLQGVDLSGLPLAMTLGGLPRSEWPNATSEQREGAAIHLEGASLGGTFDSRTHLEAAKLTCAHLENAMCEYVRLERSDLHDAHLGGANLSNAHIEQSTLAQAHLEAAILYRAHLEGVNLSGAHLEGSDLREAFFDISTNLAGVSLASDSRECARVADLRWNNVNLAVVDWTRIHRLGDELVASKRNTGRDSAETLNLYEAAVRSYRQLATGLKDQGLNELSDRYAYRAKQLQRIVLVKQASSRRRLSIASRLRSVVIAAGSLLMALTSGYGYRPGRSLVTYLVVVAAFAGLSIAVGTSAGTPLTPPEALIFSVTSFHGRGFFPGGPPGHAIPLDSPLLMISAAEAFTGFVIEIVFIAAFTQRFFGK